MMKQRTKISWDNPTMINPGPPVCLRGATIAWPLFVAIGLLCLLLAKNYVVDNYDLPAGFGYHLSHLLRYRFSTNDALVGAILASVAILYAAKQFRLNIYPHLVFSAKSVTDSHLGVKGSAHHVWSVDIINYGTGPAIISHVVYQIKFVGSENAEMYGPYEQIRESLFGRLSEFQDAVLYRYSPGAAFPHGQSMKVFEGDISRIKSNLEKLDVVIWYKGYLGDLYVKRVVCIPPYWASGSCHIEAPAARRPAKK